MQSQGELSVKLNMTVEGFFVFAAYSVFLMVSLASGLDIRSFLFFKPLGMQSFLDKVLYHFSFVHNAGTAYGFVLLGIYEPLLAPAGHFTGKTMAFIGQFISLAFMFSAFVFLAVR